MTRAAICLIAVAALAALVMLYLIPYGRDELFSIAHMAQAYRALFPHYWR